MLVTARPARWRRGCPVGMDVLRWDRAVLLPGPARLTEGSESPASGMGLGLTGRSCTRASHCPLARGVTGAYFAGFILLGSAINGVKTCEIDWATNNPKRHNWPNYPCRDVFRPVIFCILSFLTCKRSRSNRLCKHSRRNSEYSSTAEEFYFQI